MSKGTTRERILFAALDLFSEKGYDGVGVDLIAETVGIKGPSLYHHFKGKDDILAQLIAVMSDYYAANFGSAKAEAVCPPTLEAFTKANLERISFTMHDPQIRKVRILCTKEQFRNPELAAMTSDHELMGIQALYTGILGAMMEAGLLRKGDPALLALELVAPVSMLIHLCDREPHREQEAMTLIRQHLDHFVEVYGIQ